jgi:hypothetical protein
MNPFELKAMDRKATPAPWDKPEHDPDEDIWDACAGVGSEQHQVFVCQELCNKRSDCDSDLIVTLRNLAPELIALWEACKNHGHPDADYINEALAALNAKAESLA